MSIRIVQVTDAHLYRDPDGVLAGVSTWKTFRAVLGQIERQHGDFDYLILTGDLAQDAELETYLMLRETLGDWLERCRIIPGNHDDPANLRKAFPDLFSQDGGPLTFALSIGDWKIIGLDSHLPGETKGRVGADQLQWLRDQLSMDSSARALLFVHHPPIAINVDWLDKIGLDKAADLVELIEDSPQIKVICAGHVHQEFAGQIGAAAVVTTPSTCVQFGARTEKSFDTRAAGYRTFRLDDGYHTEVHRLSDQGEGQASRYLRFPNNHAAPILFVGGGYISFEFAHISARAGVQVTLLHRGSWPLVGFDPDLVSMLVERTRKLDIDVQLEADVVSIERSETGITVQASTPRGSRVFEAAAIVHGAGRIPDIDDLDLEKGRVAYDRRGVTVNEFLQSVSNPAVFAAEDSAATAGAPLTPVGGYEGRPTNAII